MFNRNQTVLKINSNIPKRYFAADDNHDLNQKADSQEGNLKGEAETRSKEELSCIQEYQEGLEFAENGNKISALERFKRVQNILKNANQAKTYNFVHITNKVAHLSLEMYQFEDAEEAFSDSLDIVQEMTNNPDLIYTHYNNLFCFYLRANQKKGILMGKALLSDQEKENIPVLYQKEFLFSLGTAYLLNGNYTDAKKQLRECLKLDPQPELKSKCQNNLALSYWWHKIPSYEFLDIEENLEVNKNYSSEDLEKEFSTVIAMFKKSIEASETNTREFNEADNAQRKRFVELLDPENIIPMDLANWQSDSDELLINNPASIKPIQNIGEFLQESNGDKSMSTFWQKQALQMAENLNNVDKARTLTFIAHMCADSEQYIKSEGLFKTCEELLKSSICFERTHMLNVYGSMLEKSGNRQTEANVKYEMANKITQYLPYWSPRLMNVMIPNFK